VRASDLPATTITVLATEVCYGDLRLTKASSIADLNGESYSLQETQVESKINAQLHKKNPVTHTCIMHLKHCVSNATPASVDDQDRTGYGRKTMDRQPAPTRADIAISSF
jgi:hypothetical protein